MPSDPQSAPQRLGASPCSVAEVWQEFVDEIPAWTDQMRDEVERSEHEWKYLCFALCREILRLRQNDQEPAPTVAAVCAESASEVERATAKFTDCRSDEGVAVGLVDGIIAQARVLRRMAVQSPAMQEALKDFRADEDVAWLYQQNSGEPPPAV